MPGYKRKRKVKDDDDEDEDEDYTPDGDEIPEDDLELIKEEDGDPPQEEHSKPAEVNVSQDKPEKADAAAAAAATAKPKRKQKLRRKINYEPPEIDLLPSHVRKTKAGGYAHTNKSKEKISMANRGNRPWNKGKQRSSSDKAKIKAGVQARNRAIKLEKLRRLGMTEEEYDKKKKEIKYLRERVRRTKLANDRHAVSQAQKKLQAALDATSDKIPAKEIIQKLHEKADKEVASKQKQVFTEEITWTPLEAWNEENLYDKICLDGGPGGLICCEDCAKKYSAFMEDTMKDLEVQRTHKLGSEVKEIVALMDKTRSDLERIGMVARKRPPPPAPSRRPFFRRAEELNNKQRIRTAAGTRSTKRQPAEEEDQEWNLTNTFDIVYPMGESQEQGTMR